MILYENNNYSLKVYKQCSSKIILRYFLVLVVTTFAFNFSSIYAKTTEKQNGNPNISQSSVEETVNVNKYNELAWQFSPTESDKSIKYGDSALQLATKINWKIGEAQAFNNIGEAKRYKGNIEEALVNHQNALEIFNQLGNKKEIANTLSLIGIAYFNLSDFPNSLENFNKASKIYSELEDKPGLVNNNSYLGILFSTFKKYDKALEYFSKALFIARQIEDKNKIAMQLGNIGLILMELNDYSRALLHYEQALTIFEEIEDFYNYSIFLGNTGIVYSKLNDFSKAHFYYERALKYATEIDDKYGIAHQFGNIGELSLKIYFNAIQNQKAINKKQTLAKSIYYLKKSVSNFEVLSIKEEEKNYLLLLSEAYNEVGNFKNSLSTYKKAKSLLDTIHSLDNKKMIAQLEIKQQFDLQEKKIEILNKEKEYNAYVTNSTIFVAIVVLLGMGIIISQYLKKKNQNKALQKHIVMCETAEDALRNNEKELKKHQNHLERLVKERTKKLEYEILEHKLTEDDLLQAIDRAEIASNAKSVFLANMSHELRTPLVGILGYSDLLSQIIEDDDAKEMAEGINRTGNRLLNTLSLVLDLARIESDKFEIEITQVDIMSELKETFDNFRAIATKKNLKLKLDLHVESLYHNLDTSMIKVILDNLVNNAIKFTYEGQVTIKTCLQEIDNLNYLNIKIIDTGIGMQKKEIPLIFEEFKQLSEGFTKDFQGSGLGLSITKKFVQQLGGTISVESSPRKGSTFTISFPIELKAVA